jgi:5-methylcytosine-specific restriction endonuclease McrA
MGRANIVVGLSRARSTPRFKDSAPLDAVAYPSTRLKKRREYNRKAAFARKQAAVLVLGGKCAACGTGDTYVLSIDHIHNDGFEYRKQLRTPGIYKWVLNHPAQAASILQVLCYNHNRLKAYHSEEYRSRFG